MKRKGAVLILYLAFSGIAFNGCFTVIGAMTGSQMDVVPKEGVDSTVSFTRPVFHKINYNFGGFARIEFRDSSFRFGTLTGCEPESDSSYTSRWRSYLLAHSDEALLAFRLGDSIVLRDGHRRYDCKFLGYFPNDSLEIELAGKDLHTPIGSWRFIGRPRGPNLLASLRTVYNSDAMPIRGVLHFRSNMEWLALNNSDFVNAKLHVTHQTWKWALVGAALDLVSYGLVESALHPPTGYQGFGGYHPTR